MKMQKLIAAAIAGFILVGCAAPQLKVDLQKSSLEAPSNRIAIAMNKLPRVDTQFPGASCLLCIGVASIAHSSLTTHTNTLPHENLLTLKQQISDALAKKGVVTQIISEDFNESDLPSFSGSGPNIARKDFSKFNQNLSADKILLISISSVGIHRDYASYIPTAMPKAVVYGTISLINLKTNTYEWYMPLNVNKFSEGAWDEPPNFPGLSSAYFQVLEMVADEIKNPIKKLN